MSDDQDSQAEDAGSAERAFALQNAAFLLQLFTLATAFVLGLGIKHLKIHWIHEAGATILLGVLVGLMISGSPDEITDWLDFDESVFFFLLLPPIIFEGGYSLRSREFFANFGAICSLAFAGTTISTFAVGFFVWICGGVGLCYSLPLLHALVFGALISATDPVTVLAIFQELGVNTELYALVFGESVLNDAVAIVLYRTLVNFNNKGVTFVSLMESAGFFLVIFVGSLAVGVLFALSATLFFKFLNKHGAHEGHVTLLQKNNHIEMALVMIAPYAAYAAAESMSLSGIVAILFCGMVMAHYTVPNLSPETAVNSKVVFKVLATLAETFVFIYMGVAMFLEEEKWSMVPFVLVAMVGCAGGRALNVFPVIRWVNQRRRPARRVPDNHTKMLLVSGLRGAIAFALASTTIRDLGEASGKVIRTATLFIVIFTVLVVGGSCNYLAARWDLGAESAWTGLDDEDESRRREAAAEGGPGGVRAGEVHAGPHEELMPEFRVETFKEGYAAAKAELGEATKQENTNYGKVRAAAKALGKVAAVTDAASVMSDIDARFLRPYLTINGSLPASRRASPERSRPPSRTDGDRADDGEGGDDSDGFRTVPLDTAASEGNIAEDASPEAPLGLPGSPAPARPRRAPPSN
jgi:sodium/hydrogen exchanger 8